MSQCFILWRLRFAVRLERQRRRSHLYLIRGGLRPTVAEVLHKLRYESYLKMAARESPAARTNRSPSLSLLDRPPRLTVKGQALDRSSSRRPSW